MAFRKIDYDICIYNKRVECDDHKCDRCGWNPTVVEERMDVISGKQKQYRIPVAGYCEVWARSPEEAVGKAKDTLEHSSTHFNYGNPERIEKEA